MAHEPRESYFYDRTGRFEMSEFISDPGRQGDLLAASIALSEKALQPR